MRKRVKGEPFQSKKRPALNLKHAPGHGKHEKSAKSESEKESTDVKHPRAFLGFDVWRENVKGFGLEKQKEDMLELIRKRLHDRICKVCSDFGYNGKCYSQDPVGCVLNRLLPEIVEAILKIDSLYLKDYLDSVRGRVCKQCTNQDDDGHCDVRDKANCGLDSYLALVVDVVEEVLRDEK